VSARDEILQRVRARLASQAPVARPSAEERRAVIPARATRDRVDLVELFTQRAGRPGATIARVREWQAVPAEIARVASDLLDAREPLPASVSPVARLAQLPWSAAGLAATPHPPGPEQRLSVTAGWAAIAETGTCVVRGGAENAHSASIVPRLNAIVVDLADVVATMEDVFARLGRERLPRTVLFVSGPSSTGDIDMRVVVPAQGPQRIHIVLVG
jgi:L-lactate dehydrogenase complex protein LldG